MAASGQKPGSAPKSLIAATLPAPQPDGKSPEIWTSLETPLSVSSTPGVQFHKHSLSLCSVSDPVLGSAGDMVVTTTALVLPSHDSQSI